MQYRRAGPFGRSRRHALKIWIDADAAPRDVKDLVFRAARRLKLETVLVANQRLQTPAGNPHVTAVWVDGGPDVADRHIVEQAVPGDLVVTEKPAEAGELAARGTGLVVVTDLASAWLNGYVPEPDPAPIRLFAPPPSRPPLLRAPPLGDHHKSISGVGHIRAPDDFHRRGRPRAFHLLAMIIGHGPHMPKMSTGDKSVSNVQGPILNKNGTSPE